MYDWMIIAASSSVRVADRGNGGLGLEKGSSIKQENTRESPVQLDCLWDWSTPANWLCNSVAKQ